jgi:alpha-beta hydrolase superfamily lysophospholipase
MGAWISLWLAARSPLRARISALVLIAPAINFFRPEFARILTTVSSHDRAALEAGSTVDLHDTGLGRLMPLRKSFVEATVPFELDAAALAEVQIPVAILHGVEDEVVPYRGSLDLMRQLGSKAVEVTFVKGADHRFSDATCLQLMQDKVDAMLKKF